MSISFLGQFTTQFINVIAPNNDLLMDELNVIYFTQKLQPYVMIWLPRTIDNSTYFVQSLGIRGNESRLYLKERKISDKYHKSSFSLRCMQCIISSMSEPARLN